MSLSVGIYAIPATIRFCKRRKLYDIPNERKVHKEDIPRLGGVCFFPCMAISAMIAFFVQCQSDTGMKFSISLWACYFFVGMTCIYIVGTVDDLICLRPRVKFAAQVFAASIITFTGLYINDLCGFCGIGAIPKCIGIPLTIFAIVFINNAINLIDGIDGLSSSLSLIAMTGFLIYFCCKGLWTYGILITGVMGVLTAFMYFNIFGKAGANKVFMGDSGSLTLGFVLSVLLVRFSMRKADCEYTGKELIEACSLLIIPVFDVFRIIAVRYIYHRNIFAADKNHIHHKLLRAGLTKHQALFAITAAGTFFIIINKLLEHTLSTTAIICLDICLWIILHTIINKYIKKKGNYVFQ